MSEPFFNYIKSNWKGVSSKSYGFSDSEKLYQRLSYIELPDPVDTKCDLAFALQNRKSDRIFSEGHLELTVLSGILLNSMGVQERSQGLKKYPFPSGGGLYPLEKYVLVNNVESLSKGIYHYSSTQNAVAKISEKEFSLEEMNTLLFAQFQSVPDAVVIMTMVKSRCFHKYGTVSYSLSLIEAGHIGQNIYLNAAANQVGCCGLGVADYDSLHDLLEVDGVNEHFLYSVALGTL